MRRAFIGILALLVGVLSLTSGSGAQGLDPQALYAQAAPAVAVVGVAENGRRGLGTAFVIRPDGWLLTASHVARGADQITVELGGTTYPARLVGYDARRDLALLRIEPKSRLPALLIAGTGRLRVGDPVVTIGNPQGRTRVLTVGTVTEIGATLPGLLPGIMVRFRARVTRGNSGGPLLDARGEVVGLVVAAGSSGGELSGLAVSGDAIRSALPALFSGARLERAWIGIAGATLVPERARSMGVPVGAGALVLEVLPRTPAAQAGLRPQDVIVALDGEPIRTWEDLLVAVSTKQPGQVVHLRIVRGAQVFERSVTLGVRP